MRTHFPFLSSRSQSCTSWNMLTFGFCRPEILTQFAISRKLCSKRAALLACAQKTHISGDRSRVWYAYSMASCDLLLSSQPSVLANALILTLRHPGQRAQSENREHHISGGFDRASTPARRSL